MQRLHRKHVAIFFFFLGALSCGFAAGAAPTFVNAANPDLPEVAQGVPMGGALEVFGLELDQVGVTSLELERFRVFDRDARLVVDNEYSVAPPTDTYFRGRVEALPNSIVVMAVPEQGLVRGLITDASGVWLLAGKSGHSAPGLANRKVDMETELAGTPFVCGAEEVALEAGDLLPGAEGEAEAPAAAGLPANVTHTARVAVETDYEYYAKFGSVEEANAYMGDLFAYASTVYEREVDTNLVIAWNRLWTNGSASDPWNASGNTSAALYEFRDYWSSGLDPDVPAQRTLAHMLSGKNLGGGVAYVGVLCYSYYGFNTDYDFGVSASLSGNFDINNPNLVWDILVVTHEIGHNFDSHHTHCYDGPVDICYGQETGCYNGPTDLPSEGSVNGGSVGGGNGTIMSYCHQQPGGFSNIRYTFGQDHIYGVDAFRVPEVMRAHVADRASVFPGCLALESSNLLLTVDKEGAGDGLITSDPAGIDCGAACSAQFAPDTMVNVQLVPNSNSYFAGWSGDCDANGDVTMDADRACTARFELLPVLTAAKNGTGDGVVTSSPAGILCGSDCSESYASGTTVTLAAAASAGSEFDAWGGDCSALGQVILDTDKTCTATFNSQCGNGSVDEGEQCDGAEFAVNAPDCGDCSGTRSCTIDCRVDLADCYNGICDGKEDCNTCAQDCVSGSVSSASSCGNGICEAGDGEDCISCPSDCAGKQTGKPSGRYCCGDGDGVNPVSCSDDRCGGQEACTEQPSQGVESYYCCGDSFCGGLEDGNICAVDCGAAPLCGDGVCNGDETQCSCAADCITDDPVCQSTCLPKGDACTADTECCSNKCKGKPGRQTCG